MLASNGTVAATARSFDNLVFIKVCLADAVQRMHDHSGLTLRGPAGERRRSHGADGELAPCLLCS